MPRLIVRSVTGCHECSYDRSQYATIARTIGRRRQRSIDRTIGRRPSRLIVHRSLIATTSRTISYDGSCHRYSPIIRESATTRRVRSRYATAAGYRSKNCRSVAPWPKRNQSYDPEIVRSGHCCKISMHELILFILMNVLVYSCMYCFLSTFWP